MATYVNDLRLKEIGTGESSGTWGTETNVNLELIGEALGYGTEGITTNANTHTTTVADGSTDPGRAMYIEYTGTLDSACTITIAPNTLSRMHFIENGTSGSQNIIIKQGSGATVTIPPGDTKAVYLDGAGSGAAVVDAFASLNVVDLKVQDDLTVTDDVIIGGDIDLEGSIDVNGTANLDIVDIDGAVDMATTLAVAGNVDFNGDLDVDGTTNLDVVDIDGAVNMATTALVTGVLTTTAATVFNGGFASNANSTVGGTLGVTGVVTANAGVVVDEMTIDGDKLTATDTFDIDAAGNITLDSDSGVIDFDDGGVNIGRIENSSSDLRFVSMVQDKDIVFRGNDAGSFINALTLDMSAAGAATFNSTIAATSATFTASTASMTLTKPDAGNFSLSFDGSNSNIASNSSGATINLQPSSTTRMSLAVGGTLTTFPLADKPAVFNENGVDADFRIESDSKTDMFGVDGGANSVNVNGGATTSYFTVGTDGTATTDEGIINVEKVFSARNTRLAGSSTTTNRTVTFVISDTGLKHIEVHVYATGNKFDNGPSNFAVKLVAVVMEESGAMRINSDQTTSLGYRLGSEEARISAVTYSSTGGGNLTGSFTVHGNYDTLVSIQCFGPGCNSISSIAIA